MNTQIIKDTSIHDEEILNFINKNFDKDKPQLDNQELTGRVIIRNHNSIVAHAALYSRKMNFNDYIFKGGIIADVVVDSNFRKKGLAKKLLLELILLSPEVDVYFLFAYNTDIYISSGFSKLNNPINFYDQHDLNWKEFVYNGGMINNRSKIDFGSSLILFNGCVY